MARLDCFKRGDVGRMTHEWERDTLKDGGWAFTPSSKIDPSRTGQDYRMEDGRADARLARRLADPGLRVDKRKHVNAVGVWVVTCPQELLGKPDKVELFFKRVYSFTQERYGAENVLQGYVHMDETTPHIHIPVVPVRDGRVSAKAVFNRAELPAYQRDLDKLFAEDKDFKRKGLILNGRTKGGYTTSELRERTADAEQAKAIREDAQKAAEGILEAAEKKAGEIIGDAQKAADGILEAAEKKAGEIREAARHAVDMKDAFCLSLSRRHKKDAATLREREAELQRREAEVSAREAALDAMARDRYQRRLEAERRQRAERALQRVRDGERMEITHVPQGEQTADRQAR